MIQELLKADELGVKLEIAGDLAIWEASPVYKHQKAVDRIRESFEKLGSSDCECLDVADVYVAFPDGSLMRPDISVFCSEPAVEFGPSGPTTCFFAFFAALREIPWITGKISRKDVKNAK